MTRTARNKGRTAKREHLDQETFDFLKKNALKQRKRKNFKLKAGSFVDGRARDQRYQLTAGYNSKDTPLEVLL